MECFVSVRQILLFFASCLKDCLVRYLVSSLQKSIFTPNGLALWDYCNYMCLIISNPCNVYFETGSSVIIWNILAWLVMSLSLSITTLYLTKKEKKDSISHTFKSPSSIFVCLSVCFIRLTWGVSIYLCCNIGKSWGIFGGFPYVTALSRVCIFAC